MLAEGGLFLPFDAGSDELELTQTRNDSDKADLLTRNLNQRTGRQAWKDSDEADLLPEARNRRSAG